jgi:hypothetical protein
MGYTHYWEVKQEVPGDVWAALVFDVEKLVLNEPGMLLDFAISASHFFLNGVGDEAYEDFFIESTKSSGFCKTNRYPYDHVVCAALIVAKHRLGDLIEVTSDGDARNDNTVEPEWFDALAFVNEILGDGHTLPFNTGEAA